MPQTGTPNLGALITRIGLLGKLYIYNSSCNAKSQGIMLLGLAGVYYDVPCTLGNMQNLCLRSMWVYGVGAEGLEYMLL